MLANNSRIFPDGTPVPPGEIAVSNLCLDYPFYRHLVFDRLREMVGALIPPIKPPIKRVLNDVSLSIKPGEMVGLLGTNGAGKTTLLKIISGLIPPTAGSVHVGGKIMALLSMGMGFRPHFTGRENIYYGGLLMGLRRREIDQIIDDIDDFAGLGAAFDQPYFTYSSGMRARLGFSLATGVPADIVILDETLAAGDRRFVAKCYRRIQDIRNSGSTILFVSHNLGEVARLTDRVILLDSSKNIFDGPTSEGLAKYEEILFHHAQSEMKTEYVGVEASLELLGEDGKANHTVAVGATVKIRLTITSETDLGSSFVFLRVADLETDHLVSYIMANRFSSLLQNFEETSNNLPFPAGTTEITWDLSTWVLGEGRYLFDIYIGPPVTNKEVDISSGRHWQRALVVNTVYANPYLKGAGSIMEIPVTKLSVEHS